VWAGALGTAVQWRDVEREVRRVVGWAIDRAVATKVPATAVSAAAAAEESEKEKQWKESVEELQWREFVMLVCALCVVVYCDAM
jgi:hypothetical protein